MPFNIGAPELLLILAIALLVLGPGKLPEVGSAMGRTIREFRKASTDVEEAANLQPRPNTLSGGTAPANASSPVSTGSAPPVVTEPAVPVQEEASR